MNDPSTTTAPNVSASDALPRESTVGDVLADLKARFPNTPFLALGQTALWDEPTKASFRRILDTEWPEAQMIAAAHDTDYFAKLPGHPPAQDHGKYALVGHDDARTRGLWSAAGEMSRLFGSEDVATRDSLEREAGVFLHRALSLAADPSAQLSDLTEAWGWTGIIYTHWDRKISRDVRLSEIAPALSDQIEWAIEGSIDCLQGDRALHARAVGTTLRGWISDFAVTNPQASLTELYRNLYPRFYELLLGAPAAHLSTSSTTELLCINNATASLPRFQFVELFLNPITRRVALDAYNLAVGGSDIYTLDRFGDGALPFDLVIPGKGRGTLCVPGDGVLFVDTPQPITLCDVGCDFSSVEKLAALIERELGPNCTLVGKAVSLLPMLAAEFLIVFHESASGYSDRTRAMMAHFARRKIALPELKPIVRVRYSAWDALAAVPPIGAGPTDPSDSFRLPEFLAQAFGKPTIPISEFASCYQCAIDHERQTIQRISKLRSPRELVSYLAREIDEGIWSEKAKEHGAATLTMMRLRDQAQAIQGRVYTFYDQVRVEKAAIADLERAKGDDFRARVQPLRERMAAAKDPAEVEILDRQIEAMQAERAVRFDTDIAARRSQVRYSLAYVRDLKEKRLTLERGEDAMAARSTLRRIEAEAELAKARLAHNALQTVNGLPHTNFRPSAWWLPLVDPSGSWFRRLADSAVLHLEPLSAPAPAR